MKFFLRLLCLSFSGVVLLGASSCVSTETIVGEEPMEPMAKDHDKADARSYIDDSEFEKSDVDGEWVSPVAEAPFAFDELIYSWNVNLREDQGFRLYLRVGFGEDDFSPWLYAGYWGAVTDLKEGRENPSFEYGHIAMDQLLLDKKADRYQFKVVDKGPAPLAALPDLYVITTDNDKVSKIKRTEAVLTASGGVPVLDLPHRTQNDSKGDWMPGRCQSAAVATALEYYGDSIPLEDIASLTWDYEYDYPGIWPRTIGAAIEHGYRGYIDRFRTWKRVEETLAQNRVILISMRMPEEGDYVAPPYKSMTGHIIALNGITEDGRVIVTDSALNAERGSQCQWLKEDMEKVWWDEKGGVGMVIHAPGERPVKAVATLPEFPGDRRRD